MGVQTVVLVVFALAAVGLCIAFVGASRSRRRLADQVARDIEPYLRRKAAETGMSDSVPLWTAHSTAEEIVSFSSDLAGRLLEREKRHPHETSSAALAQTVRAPEEGVEPGATTSPQTPRARTDDQG